GREHRLVNVDTDDVDAPTGELARDASATASRVEHGARLERDDEISFAVDVDTRLFERVEASLVVVAVPAQVRSERARKRSSTCASPSHGTTSVSRRVHSNSSMLSASARATTSAGPLLISHLPSPTTTVHSTSRSVATSRTRSTGPSRPSSSA